MSEITQLTASRLARAIRAGELTSVEVVEAHLRRIDATHKELNAFVDLDCERARSDAEEADQAHARGEALGSLHGVPLSIKSCIDVAGLKCETGSRFREGRIPEQDALLVARLRQAGAVILGVTNTPDMLMAYETDNHLYGRTNSPLGSEWTPGGSSGGESAAIAAGCSPAGFGSDGGGSVRVPAHFCGIYGLKPTPGVVPRSGHWPACAGPGAMLGLVGPMTRSAEDLQLLTEAVSGLDLQDPSSVPSAAPTPTVTDLKAMPVAYFEQDDEFPVTAETRASVREAAARLREQGFQVDEIPSPGLAEYRDCWEILFSVACYTLCAPYLEGRADDVHPLSLGLFAARERAEAMTYPKFLDAWVQRDVLKVQFQELLSRYPLLLCPTASIPAPRHGERSWTVDGQEMTYPRVYAYSQVFNLLGNPAATAPVGRSPEGLPIGVQIVGRPFDDAAVTVLAGML